MKMSHPMKETAPRLIPRHWECLVAGVGIVSVLVSAWGFAYWPTRAWPALLVSGFFFLTVSLGAVALLSIMGVSKTAECHVLARAASALTACLPVGALGMLTLLSGTCWLYPWAHPAGAAQDAAPFLNRGFFEARMITVLAIWLAFAALLRRRRGVAVSTVFLAMIPFSLSIAHTDWLMGLDPLQSARIFGFRNIAGFLSASVAALSACAIVLRKQTNAQPVLLTACVAALAGRWLDIHFQVLGSMGFGNAGIGFLDIAVFLGLGTAFLFSIDRELAKAFAGAARKSAGGDLYTAVYGRTDGLARSLPHPAVKFTAGLP